MIQTQCHFSVMQDAVLDLSIQTHAINLVFATQVKAKITKFQDWVEWAEENREEIAASIAFVFERTERKKQLIN